jgi:hypothetical protein
VQHLRIAAFVGGAGLAGNGVASGVTAEVSGQMLATGRPAHAILSSSLLPDRLWGALGVHHRLLHALLTGFRQPGELGLRGLGLAGGAVLQDRPIYYDLLALHENLEGEMVEGVTIDLIIGLRKISPEALLVEIPVASGGRTISPRSTS